GSFACKLLAAFVAVAGSCYYFQASVQLEQTMLFRDMSLGWIPTAATAATAATQQAATSATDYAASVARVTKTNEITHNSSSNSNNNSNNNNDNNNKIGVVSAPVTIDTDPTAKMTPAIALTTVTRATEVNNNNNTNQHLSAAMPPPIPLSKAQVATTSPATSNPPSPAAPAPPPQQQQLPPPTATAATATSLDGGELCAGLGLQQSLQPAANWLPDMPNHAESVPSQAVYVPPNFTEYSPVLSDDVWDAGLRRVPRDQRFLHRILLRLHAKQTITIQVYGGSMTAGVGCAQSPAMPKCAWSAQFADRIRNAFPEAKVNLETYARGGCDLKCSASFVIMNALRSQRAPDLIMLDFDQNGFGDIEQLIREIHFFLPSTLVVILWTAERKGLRMKGDNLNQNNWDDYAKVAKYYSIPLVSFYHAENQYFESGGSYEVMWSTGISLLEKSMGGKAGHHPPWSTHAYIADLLARWLHVGLRTLESCAAPSADSLAVEDPISRRPADLHVDDNWLPPLNKHFSLAEINTCLFPLTTHVAFNPDPTSPGNSSNGSWLFFQDRPGKPGWIAQKQDEWISFPVVFSKTPRMIVSYLRSYENIGSAAVKVDGAAEFGVEFLNKGELYTREWTEHAKWRGNDRTSITESVFYKGRQNSSESTAGTVSFKLIDGPKFKISSLITC
ncbi:unnamed protein product, partial [Polarella glacialis]